MGTILLENSVVVATKAKHMPVLWPAFPSLVTHSGKWVHMSKEKSIQEFHSNIICNTSNCNVPMSLGWPKCQSAKDINKSVHSYMEFCKVIKKNTLFVMQQHGWISQTLC